MTATHASKVADTILAIWSNGARIMRPDLVSFAIDTRKGQGFASLPVYAENLVKNLDYRVREQVQGYTLTDMDLKGMKYDGTVRDGSVSHESAENKVRAWIARNLDLNGWTLALDYVDANGTLYPLPLPGTTRVVRLYRTQ